MILLDTNVLSELMRPEPNDAVIRWLDTFPDGEIWISAITVGEIKVGLALLPEGRRKETLSRQADEMLEEEFWERCLPYDYQAAETYGQIISWRRSKGSPITVEDAQIAAIALSSDLTLATRNIKDFLEIKGLELVNPWEIHGT